MNTMQSNESSEPDNLDEVFHADASAAEASMIDASEYDSSLYPNGLPMPGISQNGIAPNKAEMVDVILTLERPSSESLNGMNRGEKVKVLSSNSEQLRTELLKWLDEQGLSNEVDEVGEATIFNTLFVKITSHAAEMICKAPGVTEVAYTNGLHFEITQTEQNTNGVSVPEQKSAGENKLSKRTHIVGISEIVLWTSEPEKSVHFYHDLLNLEIMSPPEMPNVFLKVGEGNAGIPQMIVLVPKPADVQVQPSGYQLHHLAFELPPEQFDDQFDALVAAGFAPRDGIHPVLSSRTMYVDDPDGNEIEFICYADHA